ncbi:sigma-54 interaction domain protein [Carnobacterium maltaromaticum LMA28]|uniref:Sigma-54 interaction domain protein n=1 Tax=Carnobacterium maltaromaticum LMA28 TaxID=1234679 RepID=K8E6R6_CARML|nr:sigma 54-interacting transcriptional regulator [Carnobacterium maltaromaticum]CCO12537.2 sigma-54 interaction domain protein [Carnobacterium maltaromaticum LMA28]
MRRIELILQELEKSAGNTGLSTQEIAESLGLTRANVSSDLNQLVAEGRATKEIGKPVLYFPLVKVAQLEKFSFDNPSLQMMIEQARAAILYPPKGLNMLFYGETGVGKSMFANLIYEYACSVKKTTKHYPFIHFNCSDYANNPQLLMGQLFGVAKNAYTGATEEKKGLIEEANGGMLFLDEIHRLPPEGQEMFFTFIDRGLYRRLGESNSESSAEVQILAATTEAPESALLKTFQRRIPMVIKIPNLLERTIEERASLITLFFNQEADRLGIPIKVSQNSMRALLSYNCPNNIGQLKNDIQLACAKVYADFIVAHKKELIIHSPELPTHVLNGLYLQVETRDIWTKLSQLHGKYLTFNGTNKVKLLQENKPVQSVYQLIDSTSQEMQHLEINQEALAKIIDTNIEEYFQQFSTVIDKPVDFQQLKNIVPVSVLEASQLMLELSEKLLKTKISTKVKHALVVHIYTTYTRVRSGEHLENTKLAEIKKKHPEAFKVALECVVLLNASLDIDIPMDEAGFIAMFFVYNEEEPSAKQKFVRVIIMTHGASTATSMSTLVNSLLGVQHAIGINMQIDESPATVMARLKTFLIESNTKEDCLFLVDMGSLNNISNEIQKELAIRCRTLPLVSTLHVLEATRKAVMGHSLDEIYRDTKQVSLYLQPYAEKEPSFIRHSEQKTVILTICLTGEGTAKLMKNILEKKIQFQEDYIQILPITLLHAESIEEHIKKLQQQYTIICVVTSLTVETDLPQFHLYDLFQTNTIARIQEIVDIELSYATIGETLKEDLKYVDSDTIVQDTKLFIQTVADTMEINLNVKVVFGSIFHISCLIDRLISGAALEPFPEKTSFQTLYQQEYQTLQQLVKPLEEKYSILIPEDEICYLLSLFIHHNG